MLKHKLQRVNQLTHVTEDEILKMKQDMSAVEAQTKELSADIAELKMESKALKTFSSQDSGWTFEQKRRELRVVLGQHEEEFMCEAQELKKYQQLLQEQEDQPEVQSVSQLHQHIERLRRELDWQQKEKLRLYEEVEVQKIGTKDRMEQEVVSLRVRAETQLNQQKTREKGLGMKELNRRGAELRQAILRIEHANTAAHQAEARARLEQVKEEQEALKLEYEQVSVEWEKSLENTQAAKLELETVGAKICLLYTSPSPRDS
eukprot:TRINITY_DN11299_c0_g1_i1.p1 TRINITY_DN11299_c0_g1~~TRINITY_DN11299_c0_g1_i1.p1  ORF type:complete len:261 (-),score=104.36 TRINITY_DN11299_c0_g1_i1:101-883(-)